MIERIDLTMGSMVVFYLQKNAIWKRALLWKWLQVFPLSIRICS